MSAQKYIAAICPSMKKPGWASIRVGRKSVATLTINVISELGLEVGRAWDDELAAQVGAEATYDQALQNAMRQIGRRAMSRKQLDDKLRQLDFAQAVRYRVLERLTELKLLDDEAFGQALIHQLSLRKAAGPRLLRQKLAQKGLAASLIDQLLTQCIDSDDQLEQATQLARQKLKSMSKLDPAARKRRLYGQLARRGFNNDTITQAMAAVADQLRGDDWQDEY